MFQRDSYSATYQGPTLATGETLRRSVSSAGAMRGMMGNARAYRQENMGVGAGSKAAKYQRGIAASQAMANAPDHRSPYLQRIAENAETQLGYERNTADERDTLRRLLFDTEQTQQVADTALRGDRMQRELGAAQRAANTQIGRLNRSGSPMGFLGSLFRF